MDYRDRLIRALAKRECTRICRSTIRYLQKIEHALVFGDEGGLKNTWDEICVQRQMGELPIWQTYLDLITPFIAEAVAHLRRPEQEAIWLQTPEAANWDTEEDTPPTVPICLDDITLYIRDAYVLHVANDYHNSRIEKFQQTDTSSQNKPATN